MYLLLEYASKGSLFHLIKKKHYLTEDEAFFFFIQAWAGIYFLHSIGLIHRDIKPENMLIGKNHNLKIWDFGWWVATDSDKPRNTFWGTLEYMCPEMILNGSHNHTLDVWCLGILLYELLHGHAPFRGNSYNTISERILKGKIRFKQGLPEDTRNLILWLLQREANDRIPLIQVFNHAWIKRMEIKYNLGKAAPSIDSKEMSRIKEDDIEKSSKNNDTPSSK